MLRTYRARSRALTAMCVVVSVGIIAAGSCLTTFWFHVVAGVFGLVLLVLWTKTGAVVAWTLRGKGSPLERAREEDEGGGRSGR